MAQTDQSNLGFSLKKSPWIILGATTILLIVVLVLAFQNTRRERRYMSEILNTKGAALIRAVEAGARTGMMGMKWGGRQVQRLLEETARLPDVLYMVVVDQDGRAVAHSDPEKIGQPFRRDTKLTHLGPELQESWELVNLDNGLQAFEVHRHFRPLMSGHHQRFDNRRPMMRHRRMMAEPENDWFEPHEQQPLLIVAGLDITPFKEAIREDIQTTVVISAILLLMGFGGLVSLFWMHSYRSAKQSLRNTSAFADEVVAHLPVGLIATDPAGRITFFNAAAASITGVAASTAKGKTQETLLPANLSDILKTLDHGIVLTEHEITCTFSDGHITPLSISATRIVNDVGAYVGQILILRDLGEVRCLQEEVRRQEKLAAIGGLAAGVAHEIRNPLSSIKGLASYFADQFARGTEARQAAGVMVQEVDRLNRAITELLALAGPTDLKRQVVDLKPLITRSIQLVRTDAANQNIRVDLLMSDTLCPVWIDPDRVAQCLLNLYLNAIEAMERGGTLTVRCAQDASGHVRIEITDTGPGIETEEMGKIFDPYFTTKAKGTGLGLAIVGKIVAAHQARLEVDSLPGRGTTMVLLIPCRKDDAHKETP